MFSELNPQQRGRIERFARGTTSHQESLASLTLRLSTSFQATLSERIAELNRLRCLPNVDGLVIRTVDNSGKLVDKVLLHHGSNREAIVMVIIDTRIKLEPGAEHNGTGIRQETTDIFEMIALGNRALKALSGLDKQ